MRNRSQIDINKNRITFDNVIKRTDVDRVVRYDANKLFSYDSNLLFGHNKDAYRPSVFSLAYPELNTDTRGGYNKHQPKLILPNRKKAQ